MIPRARAHATEEHRVRRCGHAGGVARVVEPQHERARRIGLRDPREIEAPLRVDRHRHGPQPRQGRPSRRSGTTPRDGTAPCHATDLAATARGNDATNYFVPTHATISSAEPHTQTVGRRPPPRDRPSCRSWPDCPWHRRRRRPARTRRRPPASDRPECPLEQSTRPPGAAAAISFSGVELVVRVRAWTKPTTSAEARSESGGNAGPVVATSTRARPRSLQRCTSQTSRPKQLDGCAPGPKSS